MPTPESQGNFSRARPFDLGFEQPNHSEYYPGNPYEALRYGIHGWSCGGCHRRLRVEEGHQPTQCSNENCQTEWSWIIVESNVKSFPKGFDFLPVVDNSAVDIGRRKRTGNRALGIRIVLGHESLSVINEGASILNDDTATQDE